MNSAIRIDELTKDYWVGFWRKRPYRALDRLSLEVQPGEVFGFLGPNGAGKTTTLKLLMQLIFPTAGRAEILGRPVGDVRARQRIGYLPENPSFYDYLTAEELLRYYGRLFGYSGADARRRAAALLDRLGIGPERRRQQLRKYSKGMIQRVGIAQALLNDPEVVFLDEPMSGLDPLGRRDVRSLILELRDQGRTVFFSSHILADAEALCSRVAVVAGGQLAAAGRLTDILAFQVRGWELVVAGLTPEVLARLAPQLAGSTEISAAALRPRAEARRQAGGGSLGCRGHRRDAGLAQPGPRHARGLLRAPRRRDRPGGAVNGRAIGWIAVNVFKESVRDRVPYNLAIFAVLLIASSFLLGQLTAGQDVKIIKDLGLAAIAVFGLFIAIFIGIGLVSKEVERRSVYALLSKPISRTQFIVGKYAGLVLTLAVNVAVMTVALFLVLGYLTWIETPEFRAGWDAPGVDPRLLTGVALIFVQLMLVTAIALFFSTFSTPILSAAFTLGLYLVGHFNADLKNFDRIVESQPVVWMARAIYHLVPDFSAFDVKTEVVHGLPVAAGYVAATSAYGLAYISALLVAAVVIFARRDFK